MNRRTFQLFLEKFDAIDINNYSMVLASAISLVCMKDPDYLESKDFSELMYLKENTHEDIKVPLHTLDVFVNPSKDPAYVKAFSVSREFVTSVGGRVCLTGADAEYYLFEAVVRIKILVAKMISQENWVSGKSLISYPNVLEVSTK